MLSFGTTVDFTQVTNIGFEVRSDFTSQPGAANPDHYHISAVPIPAPGAALLALFGVGTLGWARRSRRM